MKRTHGESNKSKEWNAWASMMQRCHNPKNKRFYSHGGRGIKVCERWMDSYENFLKDMGRAPTEKHSLDRKDNDGNYEPSNCKWSTKKEQANNTRRNIRVEYLGRVQTLMQWCDELAIPYLKAKARINRGMSPERAFKLTPDGARIDSVFLELNGRTQTLTEWSKELNKPYSTLRRWSKKKQLLT